MVYKFVTGQGGTKKGACKTALTSLAQLALVRASAAPAQGVPGSTRAAGAVEIKMRPHQWPDVGW